MKKENKIKLKGIPTDMDLDFGKTGRTYEISKEEFQRLSKRFGGIYGIDWYFTCSGFIKYWDGKRWNLEKYF